MSALYWVLAGLAAARTWRLLAVDGVAQRLRDRFDSATVRLHKRSPKLASSLLEGFYCPFCLGFWVTLGWVATGLAWHDTWPWQLAAGTFALSYVAGHLGAHFDKNEDTEPEEVIEVVSDGS